MQETSDHGDGYYDLRVDLTTTNSSSASVDIAYVQYAILSGGQQVDHGQASLDETLAPGESKSFSGDELVKSDVGPPDAAQVTNTEFSWTDMLDCPDGASRP